MDYKWLVDKAKKEGRVTTDFLLEELPWVFIDAYQAMTPRLTNVCAITHGTFQYLFDDYATLEAMGAVQADGVSEARLVAALGQSNPIRRGRRRDDNRLRGWIGSTNATFGDRWDKGHFIAHTIGGAVDGIEANVFVQLRSLNRGWSRPGRVYRSMENYCVDNPGVLCFSRPIYDNPSARPSEIEYGILKSDGSLWVETFANRL